MRLVPKSDPFEILDNLTNIFSHYLDEIITREELCNFVEEKYGTKIHDKKNVWTTLRKSIEQDLRFFAFEGLCSFGSGHNLGKGALSLIRRKGDFYVDVSEFRVKKSLLERLMKFKDNGFFLENFELLSAVDPSVKFSLKNIGSLEEAISKVDYDIKLEDPYAIKDIDPEIVSWMSKIRIKRASSFIQKELGKPLFKEFNDRINLYQKERRVEPSQNIWRLTEAGFKFNTHCNEKDDHLIRSVIEILKGKGMYDYEVAFKLGKPIFAIQHALECGALKNKRCAYNHRKCEIGLEEKLVEPINPVVYKSFGDTALSALRYGFNIERKDKLRYDIILQGADRIIADFYPVKNKKRQRLFIPNFNTNSGQEYFKKNTILGLLEEEFEKYKKRF